MNAEPAVTFPTKPDTGWQDPERWRFSVLCHRGWCDPEYRIHDIAVTASIATGKYEPERVRAAHLPALPVTRHLPLQVSRQQPGSRPVMTSPKPAPPLGEAAGRFLASLKVDATKRNRSHAVNPMVARFGADLPLAELDPADVRDWMDEQWGQQSAGTWNSRAASIRGAWKFWAAERWISKVDLAEALDVIARVPGREALAAEILTTEEIQALLATVSGSRYATVIRNRALIMLMYRSGLRLGEALAIRPGDLKFAAHSIRLRMTKSGKAQTRGWHPVADDALMRWIDRRAQLGINGDAPLFCVVNDWRGGEKQTKGEPLSQAYVRHMMKRLGGKAAISKRVYPHMLRHTFATEMESLGVNPEVISKLLGQSSIAVTSKYLHGLTNHEAIQALTDVRLPGWEPGEEGDDKARIARLEGQVAQLLAGRES